MSYVKDAVRTESLSDAVYQRLQQTNAVRLLHSAMGLSTESGEFVDSIKRHIFYGKPIDRVNLKEELGDIMWYIAIACDVLDLSLSDVMDANISKLKSRYPEKFTESNALNRNLETEREVLENA